MINNVYCLYNVLADRYGDIFAFPSDGYALKRIMENIARAGYELSEYQLVRNGSIDISTGVITASTPVRVPWNVSVPVESEMKDKE